MAGNGTKSGGLTPRQLRAIEALLDQPTIAAAAKTAGVSERTLFRWLNEPDFAAAYKEARSRLIEDALEILQRASTDAAQCLRDLVVDKAVSVYVRLGAAKAILELSLRSRELEIDERLAALEQLFDGKHAWR